MCGSQASVARKLGVDADTIHRHYRDDVVPALYENAILFLVLRTKLSPLITLIDEIGEYIE